MAFRNIVEFIRDLPKLRSWDNSKTKKWIEDIVSSSSTGMENTANTTTINAPEVIAEDYPYRCLEFNLQTTFTQLLQFTPINQTMSFKETLPGPGQHTIKLADGTFDGTNNTALFVTNFNTLIVHFDSNKNGTVIVNIGPVILTST